MSNLFNVTAQILFIEMTDKKAKVIEIPFDGRVPIEPLYMSPVALREQAMRNKITLLTAQRVINGMSKYPELQLALNNNTTSDSWQMYATKMKYEPII